MASFLNPLKLLKRRKGSQSTLETPSESLLGLKSTQEMPQSLSPSGGEEKPTPTDQDGLSVIKTGHQPAVQQTQPIPAENPSVVQRKPEEDEEPKYNVQKDDEVPEYSTYPDHTIPVVIDSLEGFPRISTDVRRSSSVRTSDSSAVRKGKFRHTPTNSMDVKNRSRAASLDFTVAKAKGKVLDDEDASENHGHAWSGVRFSDVTKKRPPPQDEEPVSPGSS